MSQGRITGNITIQKIRDTSHEIEVRSSSSGFTLIEIIITLTVTAVLATMIYMYFGKAFSESVTPITRLQKFSCLAKGHGEHPGDYNVIRNGEAMRLIRPALCDSYELQRTFVQMHHSGNSGSNEPTNWPLNNAGTVTDNGVTWTESGSPWTSTFLTTLKGNIGTESSDQTANNYGKNPDGITYTKYNVVRNRFTQFVNDIDQDSDASGANKILKVTLKNDNGETLTALFFSY